MVTLETKNLTKIYHIKNRLIQALVNCNIQIHQGEFVIFSGKSGSGKSTLLHMLAGIERPSSGHVFLDKQDIYSLSDDDLCMICRKKVGCVFQHIHLIPGLTVKDNIRVPLLIDQRMEDKSLLKDLVDSLHISNILSKYPRDLSNEQQQRVGVVRALVNQPELLLADEPTCYLEEHMVSEILDLLMSNIQKRRLTLVIVTNNPYIALFANRIIKLEKGHIVDELIK